MKLRWQGSCDLIYKTKGSNAFDVQVDHDIRIMRGKNVIELDLSFDLKKRQGILLYPRSSAFTKHDCLMNTAIIDSDYKGKIHLICWNMGISFTLNKGESILQGAAYKEKFFSNIKQVNLVRTGGLGSTGA